MAKNNLFHVIDDVQVITYSRGIYKQVPAYYRGEDIFAKHGSGFIKLVGNKGTSTPNVSWLGMDHHTKINLTRGRFGCPCWNSGG